MDRNLVDVLDEMLERCDRPVSSRFALAIVMGQAVEPGGQRAVDLVATAEQVAESGAPVAGGYDHEMEALGVRLGGRLLGKRQAFGDQLGRYGPVQVEAPAHRPGRGQHFIDRQLPHTESNHTSERPADFAHRRAEVDDFARSAACGRAHLAG